jgi:hypothetical protein
MANTPIDTHRDGNLEATIWKNPGENGAFYSVTFSRTWKDEAGSDHDSDSYTGMRDGPCLHHRGRRTATRPDGSDRSGLAHRKPTAPTFALYAPCRTPLLDHERVSAPHAAGGLVHEEEHLGLDARGRDPHLRPLVLFLADPEGALGISM